MSGALSASQAQGLPLLTRALKGDAKSSYLRLRLAAKENRKQKRTGGNRAACRKNWSPEPIL